MHEANHYARICAMLLPSVTLGKDDHHECEAALDKMKSAKESDFTGTGHHEFQQAKQAHADGDFKKCADQAEKALAHQKSE
ncbi:MULTISPECIES: hypothetical protein [Pseudomonas]|uniref:Uncharacterized protein n=1 Tax=Pseudomonas juntendi TaxID=2666183 RepID=A0A7W2R1L5_9PSED|nr:MULTISPECIES: hypothetical protein [Pseudomonas]MBA6134381.1 hypothetical protein [Pseudomonas juntendi]MBA6150025.1 hypothetical protein [Pseudomonas juntendi]MCK2112388.1 hypothetical protein [Pseudomonas juntendi]MCK2116444.1 hypothetical protein [Pseudomonas juntendi]MRT61215.1 hypothetical protein [Pseudomonas sp. CAH-1]